MNYSKALLAACLIASLGACANRDSKHGPLIGYMEQVDLVSYPSNLNYIDRPTVADFMRHRRNELERALAPEIANKQLQISQFRDGSIKVGFPSDAYFDKASAQIKPAALNTFSKIARVLVKTDHIYIHVVGHTDSEGSDANNQALSERRSSAVSSYMTEVIRSYVLSGSGFAGSGLSAHRITAEGRGKREPVANNNTSEGQRKNRRVDIIIKPVVEGNEDAAAKLGSTLGS